MQDLITNETFDAEEFEVNNLKVTVQAHNPHGFYHIHLEKGRLPEELKGRYTTKLMAVQEAKKHLAGRGLQVEQSIRPTNSKVA